MKIKLACHGVEFADNSRQTESQSMIWRECIDALNFVAPCTHDGMAGAKYG
jgi:hypothetical protein